MYQCFYLLILVEEKQILTLQIMSINIQIQNTTSMLNLGTFNNISRVIQQWYKTGALGFTRKYWLCPLTNPCRAKPKNYSTNHYHTTNGDNCHCWFTGRPIYNTLLLKFHLVTLLKCTVLWLRCKNEIRLIKPPEGESLWLSWHWAGLMPSPRLDLAKANMVSPSWPGEVGVGKECLWEGLIEGMWPQNGSKG